MQRNKESLEAEQARLQNELSCMNAAMDERERPGYGTHMADNASEVFEQAKTLAVCQRLRLTLVEVNRALEKMDQGVYMVCDRCGKRIDPARLKALPHATLCKSCQARAELGSRSR
jgi:DnaK suppressor protein